jgi:hypothetical protein
MSLPVTLPEAILDTILDRLAVFFLAAAGNDMTAARDAVRQLLSDYSPQTARELNLAAETITLQMHALNALCHAAGPDLSDNKVLRLRGCAVSLSREQHKAHRKLDQIQKVRQIGTPVPESARDATIGPAATSPRVEKAIAFVEAERRAAPPATPAKIPSLQSFHKQEAARIITENLKRRQAEHASQTAAIAASAQPAAATATSVRS